MLEECFLIFLLFSILPIQVIRFTSKTVIFFQVYDHFVAIVCRPLGKKKFTPIHEEIKG